MGTIFHVYCGVVLAGVSLRSIEFAYQEWRYRKAKKAMDESGAAFQARVEAAFDRMMPGAAPPVQRERGMS